MANVLVIDDAEIGRLGRCALLEQHGHRAVPLGWADLADGAGPTVSDVDLVLAALRPDASSWDRYHHVAELAGLRAVIPAGARIVGLLWGPAIDNPMLGIRLSHCGVGELFDNNELAAGTSLAGLVEGRLVGADPLPTNRDLAMLGVGPGTDPDGVIAWVLERGDEDPAHLAAFMPGCQQNQSGLSRRRAHRLRVQVAALSALRADVTRMGGGPVKDQSLPRWSEVIAIANLCRGATPDSLDRQAEPLGFAVGGWWRAASY